MPRVPHRRGQRRSPSLRHRSTATTTRHHRYDSRTTRPEAPEPLTTNVYAWPALYPDGTVSSSRTVAAGAGDAQLYAVPPGTAVPLRPAARPAWAACPCSPRTASTWRSTSGAAARRPRRQRQKSLAARLRQATNAFSNVRVALHAAGRHRGLADVLPDQRRRALRARDRPTGATSHGTRSTCDWWARCSNTGTAAELWWVDGTKTAARLDLADGNGYLPTRHRPQDDDAQLRADGQPGRVGRLRLGRVHEPPPVRQRGDAGPVLSDPRSYDPTTAATTKKLWVAAIDLNAKPGHRPEPPRLLPARRRSCSRATRAATGSSIPASRTARAA